MKVHKVTLYILDFDRIGAEEVADVLENSSYANDCIAPNVLSVETREIGEWDDASPLNNSLTAADEIARIFAKQGNDAMNDEIKIPEGFTRWGGGECPVPPKEPVRLMFRGGSVFGANQAGTFFWGRDEKPSPGDIIAYKIEESAT